MILNKVSDFRNPNSCLREWYFPMNLILLSLVSLSNVVWTCTERSSLFRLLPRNGLQAMFSMCEKYFSDHKITISTNPDVKKSKTKCIYFSHNRSKEMPAPIMLGQVPLPWVDSWAHLGNNLNRDDLSVHGHSTLDSDTKDKRRRFIGKYHSLRQEFGFLRPEILFKIIEIYTTSFYGSNLSFMVIFQW